MVLPTEFEFDFLVQGERYQYDFSVLKGAILSESRCLYGEDRSYPMLISQMQADKDRSLKDFLCTLLHKADIDIYSSTISMCISIRAKGK